MSLWKSSHVSLSCTVLFVKIIYSIGSGWSGDRMFGLGWCASVHSEYMPNTCFAALNVVVWCWGSGVGEAVLVACFYDTSPFGGQEDGVGARVGCMGSIWEASTIEYSVLMQ